MFEQFITIRITFATEGRFPGHRRRTHGSSSTRTGVPVAGWTTADDTSPYKGVTLFPASNGGRREPSGDNR